LSSDSEKIYNVVGVGSLSLVNSIAGEDANGLLVLKNIDSRNLTVNKIIIDGVDHNFSTTLFNSEEKSFKLYNIGVCTGNKKDYSIKIEYVSNSGLTKNADFKTI
jgi:hypothetical protein